MLNEIELLKKRMQRGAFSCWNNAFYFAVTPQADCDELAELGDRLMFKHGGACNCNSVVFTAEKGVLHAGFVLGIMEKI